MIVADGAGRGTGTSSRSMRSSVGRVTSRRKQAPRSPSASERNTSMVVRAVATRWPARSGSAFAWLGAVTGRLIVRLAAPRAAGVSLHHLLREVVLLADLADELELGLDPVGVLL